MPLFSNLYSSYVGTETEKKTAADQTLRDLIKDELSSSNQSCSPETIKNILDVITISVAVAKQGTKFLFKLFLIYMVGFRYYILFISIFFV